ncbi:MAG: aldehyde ferredoxin oxidoreductase N-terminal domain-containing protein, partial [Promethearchaeota archaeon]
MILLEKKYEIRPIEKGYANRTLYVNLSAMSITIKPVSKEMKEKFIGGKGFDLWLMWNSLPKDKVVKWNDPENEICIASGPLGGNSFIPGSGKAIVTSISPLTGIIIDSNVGGYFGPYLKFSGFDALEIQGKAEKEVIIFINGEEGIIRIEEAEDVPDDSHLLTQELTERYSNISGNKNKQQLSVVSTGPAAEYTNWGILNFSWYIEKRKWASYKQAGRGGIGTVFKDKNIKALVCYSPRVTSRINHPADFKAARNVGKEHNREIIKNDRNQNEMRVVGTGHLPEIMNRFDLLPTENFRFGCHKELKGDKFPFRREIWREIYSGDGKGNDNCSIGCTLSCSHFSKGHKVLTGPYKDQKVLVDGPEYETIAGCGSNWGVWDPKW